MFQPRTDTVRVTLVHPSWIVTVAPNSPSARRGTVHFDVGSTSPAHPDHAYVRRSPSASLALTDTSTWQSFG